MTDLFRSILVQLWFENVANLESQLFWVFWQNSVYDFFQNDHMVFEFIWTLKKYIKVSIILFEIPIKFLKNVDTMWQKFQLKEIVLQKFEIINFLKVKKINLLCNGNKTHWKSLILQIIVFVKFVTPRNLVDQYTLFKPEGPDYTPHTTASPPGFKKLPMTKYEYEHV